MRFLSVAERELRAAARRSGTYYVRWLTGVAFFVLLVWLIWVFHGFSNQRVMPEVFRVFSICIFIYCLIVGTARTADCLSSEKREGTLGLLYLTNLNSAEIVAGKLCSNALAAVYGLVAIFPILALPLLMGGITAAHFWQTVLALLNTIFLSLAAGFLASSVYQRQFASVAAATGLALVVGVGLLGVAGVMDAYQGNKWCINLLAVFCPLYALLTADGSRMFGGNHYWLSLTAGAGLSLVWLVLVAGRMSRTWRDRPEVARNWKRFKFWQRAASPPQTRDAGLRRRLLDINPFYWLAGRNLISAPVFMGLAVVLVLVTAYVTVPFFGRVMRAGVNSPMIGCLFGWFWAAMALHVLSLYYAAMISSQRLAEDKQVGALEMILCTPTTERSISRGLWLAFGRRMFFPGLLCLLVHCFFIWQCMIMASLEPPGAMPAGGTPGEFFQASLFNQPIRGHRLDWSFVFMFQILLLLPVLLVMVGITLGWVGRWLGLRMKHAGFAPMIALALVFIPPILIFSFTCYLFVELRLDRMGERRVLPLLMWIAFGIGVSHCCGISLWAARHLRKDFRTTVTSRFQPAAPRNWWRLNWRGLTRFALRTAGALALLALLVPAFYGYQNWQSRRTWRTFQTELKQRGETLELAGLLPGPVADEANFIRHPAFRELTASTNAGPLLLLNHTQELQLAFARYAQGASTYEWTGQKFSPLPEYAGWLGAASPGKSGTSHARAAAEILRLLEPLRGNLRDLAGAAQRPGFQITTNRDPAAVICIPAPELMQVEHLQFLFTLRATALVGNKQTTAAAEDLVTALRLAQLARQSPDVKSSQRVQVMLVRAFQPLWEGLRDHVWSEPQLLSFQEQLARFDLIADHTNAIQRVVRAHIANWRQLAENPALPQSVLNAAGGYTFQDGWRWQPRMWWFDKCLQLYHAGKKSCALVEVTNELIRLEYSGDLLDGLPLSDEAQQLLEPYYWSGVSSTHLAFAQTALDQARIACALERYWLKHRQYPATLNALVPGLLQRVPPDMVRGRPMLYEQTTNGLYALRGVGPNQNDDRKKRSSDDWLWAYPTNLPPAVIAPAK